MKISVTSNIKEVLRGMSNIAKQQMPFAASKAINATMDELKDDLDKEISKKLDRPTPFTKRTFKKQYSRKNNLVGVVYGQDIQAAYLSWQEDGGSRSPKHRANVVPRGMRTNAYGNMPNKAVAKMLSDKVRYFSGVPKGRPGAKPGVWRRMGRGGRANIRLEVQYFGAAQYGKRTDFGGVAERTIVARFDAHFRRELAAAIANAK